ncbi:hypothetical protein, partial [Enterobacter hormaechei]|uniref:hypothetical protein n=1 Tax=Enterobacter hormaechei TaxID=158836 RepID=UPI0023E39C98
KKSLLVNFSVQGITCSIICVVFLDGGVKTFKIDLLSVAQLLNNGFKLEFMHGKTRLLDDKGKLIGSGI